MKEYNPNDKLESNNQPEGREVLPKPEGSWIQGDFSDVESDSSKFGTYNEHGGMIVYVSKTENAGGLKYFAPADEKHRSAVRAAGYRRNESISMPYQNKPMEGTMRQEFLLAFGNDWRDAVAQEEKQAHIDSVRKEEERQAAIDAIRKDLGI